MNFSQSQDYKTPVTEPEEGEVANIDCPQPDNGGWTDTFDVTDTTNWKTYELRFGKYRGHVLGEMLKDTRQRGYLRYLLRWDELREHSRNNIEKAIAVHEAKNPPQYGKKQKNLGKHSKGKQDWPSSEDKYHRPVDQSRTSQDDYGKQRILVQTQKPPRMTPPATARHDTDRGD